jgi:hypothetical protein
MLTKVETRTAQGALLSLPLGDVSGGAFIEDIDGLDPVKATIVSSSFAGLDGVQYQSSRRESRNILLKLGLEPDYSVETVWDLRSRLYNFFMPKAQVYLRFFLASGLVVDISGRVESFEAKMFVQNPTADISIICFNPDFVDLDSVTFSGSTTSTTAESLITYDGSVDSGILFTLNVDRVLSEFAIYHKPPNDELRIMEFSAPLSAGDVLEISTVPGAKWATLTRAGSESSILYGVSPQSNWTELEHGDNYIRVYAEGAAIPYTIEYTNKYGGL